MEDGGSQWKIGLSIVFLGVTGILLIGITMLFIDSSSSWNGNWKLRCKIVNIYSFQRIIQHVYWIKQIFVKMLQGLLKFQDQVIFNFSNYFDWILMFECFLHEWLKENVADAYLLPKIPTPSYSAVNSHLWAGPNIPIRQSPLNTARVLPRLCKMFTKYLEIYCACKMWPH